VVRLIEAESGGEGDRPQHPCRIDTSGEIGEGEDDGVVIDTNDPYPTFAEDYEDHTLSALIKCSDEIRELGNTAFKAGDWIKALQKYEKAIRYLEWEKFPSDEEKKKINEKLVPCLSNHATVALKLNRPLVARDDGKRAIELDPANGKAWLRLGQAWIALKDDEEALTALRKAEELLPEEKSIKPLIANAKKRIAEEKKKEAHIWSKMFA